MSLGDHCTTHIPSISLELHLLFGISDALDHIEHTDYTAMSEKDEHDHPSAPSESTSDTSSEADDPASRTPSLSRGVAESIKSDRRSKSDINGTGLDRVHSARYPDDNAVYHSHEDDGPDLTDDSSLEAAKVDTIQEVRGGMVNERDVDLERGQQPASELEKMRTLRSTKSRHGGKLVSCEHVDYCPSLILTSGIGNMGRTR